MNKHENVPHVSGAGKTVGSEIDFLQMQFAPSFSISMAGKRVNTEEAYDKWSFESIFIKPCSRRRPCHLGRRLEQSDVF
jgi:hypothetical protein